jgi:hypothetical protein
VARARNIKPGLFKNEILGVADPLYTLMFEGLWILADRAGRLEDRPLRIKAEVFPYRDADANAMLDWLQESGFIRRYTVAGKRYILILEFVKHQNPHKNEVESTIPAPSDETDAEPEEIGTEPEEIGSTRADPGFLIPDSLTTDSLPSPTGEVSGPAQRAAPPPPPPDFDGRNGEALNGKSIVQIAPAWELPEQWGVDAEALGWKPAQVLRESEKFRQYWVSGRGKGTRRSVKGWRQAWSNWLEKAARDQR